VQGSGHFNGMSIDEKALLHLILIKIHLDWSWILIRANEPKPYFNTYCTKSFALTIPLWIITWRMLVTQSSLNQLRSLERSMKVFVQD
jgi:hypothetical protein